MSNGVTKYDYDEIDKVVARLKAEATAIGEEATRLYGSVKGAMDDWAGATFDAYELRSQDLKNDLAANNAWLDEVAMTMKRVADEFAERDQAGAAGLNQG